VTETITCLVEANQRKHAALVQSPFQLGYSVPSEGDYPSYFNASSIPTDDLQSFTQRHALTNQSFTQPIAGRGSNDIRYGVPLSTMSHPRSVDIQIFAYDPTWAPSPSTYHDSLLSRTPNFSAQVMHLPSCPNRHPLDGSNVAASCSCSVLPPVTCGGRLLPTFRHCSVKRCVALIGPGQSPTSWRFDRAMSWLSEQ
jgi:hypothetical protein